MSSKWDDPAEMLARAQTARAAGDREIAYQMYARASELNPQDALAWQGRADTATSSDEALVSYAYASALEPDDAPLVHTLDASIAQRIHSATKSDLPLLIALGQELAEVGLTGRAHQVFERASELDASSTDALVWLAGTSSDDQQQLDYLNRALITNPRDPRARAGLLTVKLPTPPLVQPGGGQPATTETDAASPPLSPSPTAQSESDAMERLRTSRVAVPPTDKPSESRPGENLATPAPSNRSPLQWILIGLLVLVLLLFIAGNILLQQ